MFLIMSKLTFKTEQEHQGPFWKHPYFLYVMFTTVLFLFLILMAWLAWEYGWIPNRRVHS